ncbi:methyl-viologen-reducing hydrogenase subunit delta [Dissulfuribacter thermophilus]|uniref:Methyl-viologen-reducing hydrogenase subunit delta n=1 Tax=Dissulfuribacter thermophilus TaxID=1156395 RepID=A0A1B9F5G8_9BACT|nr:hydrogenase iron-sulfur subunit [Dissulfuribacter thermophilus]OCC15187.1 methyl-viologen-reducing hydrogenase subunit delta [Dissulfuribacter thermophilus]
MLKILVFSTNTISDPGIDLAGASHLDYPLGVSVISVPCSSGIDPRWILYALKKGFDGVFIAADGTDCSFLQDCTKRTADVVKNAQELVKINGMDPRRIKMAAICSVCSEAFQNHMKKFEENLKKLCGEQDG